MPLAHELRLAHLVRAPARIEDLEDPDQDEQEDAHGHREFDQRAALMTYGEPSRRPPQEASHGVHFPKSSEASKDECSFGRSAINLERNRR